MDLASTDMTEIDGGPRRLAGLLGISTDGDPVAADENVLQALDIDIRGVGGVLTPEGSQARRISETEFVDAWGIGYRFNGHHHEAVGRPLAGADLDDLKRYPWPDPDQINPRQIAALRDRARYLREQTPYVVCGRHPVFGIMELGCWMCGFEDFLCRMAGDPEFVHGFFERILAYQKRVGEIYYGAVGPYLHFTTSGDDFGTQIAPFLSPAMFHDLIAPYMAERIKHLRQFTEARFFHHSCGSIYPLIPELIRIGVEILNPIQPRTRDMEPQRLKADFGDRLTFYGGVDTQELLRLGTPQQVHEATRGLIATLSHNGGYVLSAAHCLQDDVPDQNILAMFSAGRGCRISSGNGPL